ncbi:DUF7537 family lipoprotein [Halarchaeum salinum]|uniref:Lipoprotein n=1 Tax=Halarchaeum salinum TaxID=489912 RepID=A0AAV3S9A4_9EURY
MPRRTLLAAALAALCVLAGCAGFLPGGPSDGGANATQPYETPISTADVQTALDDAGSYRGVIVERDHRENTTFPRATSVTRHTVVANTTSGERLVRTILTNHENDTFDRTSYQPAEGVGYVNRTFEGETEFRLAGPDARTPVRGTLRAVGNVSFAYNGTVHRDGRTLHHYRGTGTSNPALHRNGSDPLRSASLLVTPDGVPVEFRFVWATDFGELTVSLSLADLGSASVPPRRGY